MSLLLMGNKRNSVHCVTETDCVLHSVARKDDQPSVKMQRNNASESVDGLPDIVKDAVCGASPRGSPQRCCEATSLGQNSPTIDRSRLQQTVSCFMCPIPYNNPQPRSSLLQQDIFQVRAGCPSTQAEGNNRIACNNPENNHPNSTATNFGRVLQLQQFNDHNRLNCTSSINSDLKLVDDSFRRQNWIGDQSSLCQQDAMVWHSGGSSSSGGSCCSGGIVSCARESRGFIVQEPVYENASKCRNTSSSRRQNDLTKNCENSSPRCSRVERKLLHGDTKDLEGLRETYTDLLTCGFYHGSMAMPDAKRKLKRTTTGTFLIRDSSDPKFLYSLSVKTDRGTTSVRIVFESRKFRLDCDNSSLDHMPSFSRILNLIEHYVEEGKGASSQGGNSRKPGHKKSVWLESSGRKDTPVYLRKPCANSVLSLKHLCRTAVNKQSSDVTPANHKYSLELRLAQLPDQLRQYMSQYPYRI